MEIKLERSPMEICIHAKTGMSVDTCAEQIQILGFVVLLMQILSHQRLIFLS